MTDTASKSGPKPFTHVAYFFIRTGMFKRRVYGYWKDGGRFRPEDGEDFYAKADMMPIGGWDGRILFRKIGDPPPGEIVMAPQRPGSDEDEAEESEG